MKTIVLDTPGAFRLTDTQPDAPAAGEALVRVHRVGICGTDLHAYRGRQPFFSYPRILGHELGVEIVAFGPDTAPPGLAVGDICAVEPYLNCGQCGACRRGKTNCCEKLHVLGVHSDGGMREFITVPVGKLHKAAGVPVEHLAMVEMLCIGAHAVRRAQLTPSDAALVIGAGPIGLGVMQFARLAGIPVIGAEISPNRIEFAQRHLGVDGWVDPRADGPAQARALLGGELPTVVFDATGNAQSMNQSFDFVANGGKLVFVGLVQDRVSFYDPEFHRREMTLLSSRNATSVDFATVIAAMAAGELNLDPWITHRASPEEMIATFEHWLDPSAGVVKAMLTFD
jgi:2-desacetyl-2-hydroxyethyl bacteriochlorophyllide A dehydrogenase